MPARKFPFLQHLTGQVHLVALPGLSGCRSSTFAFSSLYIASAKWMEMRIDNLEIMGALQAR